MGKVYTIYKANKTGSRVVLIPAGFPGFEVGVKVTWEYSNGVLILKIATPSTPAPVENSIGQSG